MLLGDVDKKDNPGVDMAELKNKIARLPYVLSCAYSVRGGLWFVVRLPDNQTPDTLAAHFRYVQKLFSQKYHVVLDSSKGGNPTDLRYVSYDDQPHINELATVMFRTSTPKPKLLPMPAPTPITARKSNALGDIDADELERQHGQSILSDLVGEPLLRDGQVTHLFDMTAHSAEKFYTGGKNGKPAIHNYSTRQTWFPINAYREKHGLSYAEALNELAQIYAGIQPQHGKTILPTANAPIMGLAVGSNPALSKKVPQPCPVTVVTHVADWKYGTILRPDESQLERLTVEPFDTYPADWDVPSEPGRVPALRVKSFHEFQQQHPEFSKMGLASINR